MITFLGICAYINKYNGVLLGCGNWHIRLNSHFIDLAYFRLSFFFLWTEFYVSVGVFLPVKNINVDTEEPSCDGYKKYFETF